MPEQTYLEWPFLEDRHRELAVEFRCWADREIAPLSEKEPKDDAGLDDLARELVKRLAAGDWLQYSVPSPWGGKYETLDVRALCLMRETLAQYSGMADFSFVMQGLGSGPISLFGSEDIRRKYLPDVAAGKRIAAFALSEIDSGSDVAAMTTNARLDGDHYVLNGAKTLISNGGLADQYVVFCRTEDAPGARGLSALVVDADTAGFDVTERFDVIAPHPSGGFNSRIAGYRQPISSVTRETVSKSRCRRWMCFGRPWVPPRWVSPVGPMTKPWQRPADEYRSVNRSRITSSSKRNWPMPQ